MFMLFSRRFVSALLALMLLFSSAMALTNEERDALFDLALEELLTPDQLADETGMFGLHPGDSAYAPCVSPGVIPFDEIPEDGLKPTRSGVFTSSDESVVTVSPDGLMTGVGEGEAEVVCLIGDLRRTRGSDWHNTPHSQRR